MKFHILSQVCSLQKRLRTFFLGDENCIKSRVRPKLCFGYGFGAETAKFFGFGMVSVMAVTRILVSAWFQLRP